MTTDAIRPPPEPIPDDGADFGAIDADLSEELGEDGLSGVGEDVDITL